jgi:hypothetical protein
MSINVHGFLVWIAAGQALAMTMLGVWQTNQNIVGNQNISGSVSLFYCYNTDQTDQI